MRDNTKDEEEFRGKGGGEGEFCKGKGGQLSSLVGGYP